MIKRQEIQNTILDAALSIALEHGFSQVTFEKIAKIADVSFGTARNYFVQTGKPIWLCLGEYVADIGYNFLEDRMSVYRQKANFNPVHAYIRIMFEWSVKYRAHTSFWLYAYHVSSTDETEDNIGKNSFERAWLRVEGYVNEAVGRGIYQPVTKSMNVAKSIHSVLLGYWISFLVSHSKPSEKDIDTIIRVIDQILMTP